jgi:hypothetical protein
MTDGQLEQQIDVARDYLEAHPGDDAVQAYLAMLEDVASERQRATPPIDASQHAAPSEQGNTATGAGGMTSEDQTAAGAGGMAPEDQARWDRQLECVMRRGGCVSGPTALPGGTVTPESIKNANDECRKEGGAEEGDTTWPFITPTEDQCNPLQAPPAAPNLQEGTEVLLTILGVAEAVLVVGAVVAIASASGGTLLPVAMAIVTAVTTPAAETAGATAAGEMLAGTTVALEITGGSAAAAGVSAPVVATGTLAVTAPVASVAAAPTVAQAVVGIEIVEAESVIEGGMVVSQQTGDTTQSSDSQSKDKDEDEDEGVPCLDPSSGAYEIANNSNAKAIINWWADNYISSFKENHENKNGAGTYCSDKKRIAQDRKNFFDAVVRAGQVCTLTVCSPNGSATFGRLTALARGYKAPGEVMHAELTALPNITQQLSDRDIEEGSNGHRIGATLYSVCFDYACDKGPDGCATKLGSWVIANLPGGKFESLNSRDRDSLEKDCDDATKDAVRSQCP